VNIWAILFFAVEAALALAFALFVATGCPLWALCLLTGMLVLSFPIGIGLLVTGRKRS